MTTLCVMGRDGTEPLIDAFAEFQRYRNLSERTVRRRSCSLGLFERYIAPLPIINADRDLIEEWLGLVEHAATRAAYRSDLNAFYRWAVKRRIADVNPVDDVEPVRVRRGLPKPVDVAAIPWLVRYAPDDETRFAVALAAYAGLRLFELAAITTDDLSMDTNPPVLIVRQGKGAKDRIVPMHPDLVAVLRDAKPGRLCPHSVNTIGRKVTRHLRDAGFLATTHALRHSFGTEAARACNGNLLVVRDLMGHTSPETTVRYTAFASSMTAPVVSMMYPSAS